MLVNIKANPAPGHAKCFAARRGFTAALTPVEIVDLEGGADVPDVEVEHDGQKYMVADLTRIGRKAFEELKNDGRFTILADGESENALSQQAVDAAKSAAGKAAARAGELEAENAALKEQIAALTAKLEAVDAAKSAAASDAEAPAGKNKGKGEK
jgi:hypothetical protein